VEISSQISPLDVGVAEDERKLFNETTTNLAETELEQDEWEMYWNTDSIPEDAYNNVNCSGHHQTTCITSSPEQGTEN
jgi:hypothetical protein